jgi:DNA-binding response OmpR family regulator
VKILLAESDLSSSGATRRLLEAAGHAVDVARTGEEAAQALARRPQVLILDVALRGRAPLDILRAIRAAERCEHLYVLVVSSRAGAAGAADLAGAFAAGADDFARKPLAREELLARIEGAARLRTAVTKLSSPAEPFASLELWSSFPRLVQEAVSATLQVPLAVRRLRSFREERLRASAPVALGSLAQPVGASELRLAIVGLNVGGPAVAAARGPTPRERAARVILDAAAAATAEIAREALADDVPLVGRPARALAASELPAVFACAPLLRKFELEGLDNGVQLVVFAAVAASESVCILASNLREGMMVARDVRNASGAVLVPAGARLTHASATRMASAVGPSAFVEVSLEPGLNGRRARPEGRDDDDGYDDFGYDDDERAAA